MGLITGIFAKNSLSDDNLNIRVFEANTQLGSYYRDGMRYMLTRITASRKYTDLSEWKY